MIDEAKTMERFYAWHKKEHGFPFNPYRLQGWLAANREMEEYVDALKRKEDIIVMASHRVNENEAKLATAVAYIEKLEGFAPDFHMTHFDPLAGTRAAYKKANEGK